MSDPFRIVAIISAFNEGDIISQVIRHLVENGVNVYLIDNRSTDCGLTSQPVARPRPPADRNVSNDSTVWPLSTSTRARGFHEPRPRHGE